MVVIMRGVSGGGKSTFARRLKDGDKAGKSERTVYQLMEDARKIKGCREIFSADDFFVKDGVYSFDRSKIAAAHADCLQRFVEFVRADSRQLAIVDNTNTTVGELAPYAAVARAYGHEVHIVEVDPSDSDLGGDAAYVGHNRNVHGVPLETTQRQQRNIEMSRKLIVERYGEFHTLWTGKSSP